MAEAVEQAALAADSAQPKAKKKANVKKKKTPGAKKIIARELPAFTRQLSAMLSSGMPVVHTLEALYEQTDNKVFKEVITGLQGQIEGGASFSEALLHYPDLFDELYVSMMKAGEQGGLLAETTSRIALFLEEREKLKRKVGSAMMYPAIVLTACIVLAACMIIWIVPVFAGIYEGFGAKLPGPTQFLVNVSDAVRHHSLFVIAAMIIIGVAFGRFKRTTKGQFVIDRVRINFPVLGDLMRKVALSRFASTFAQLTRAGVPILQAMEIVSAAMGNKVLAQVILDARSNVERGEPLSEALAESKDYPKILVHMLAAGEKTGKVDDMLQRISEFYDDEVENMLAGLTSMIEPLLIVVMGVLIGGIVVCMFMPIFKMHEIINM